MESLEFLSLLEVLILSGGMKHVEKNYKQYEEGSQEFYFLDLCSSLNSAFH